MLNYLRADCYRLFSGFKAWLWALTLIVLPPAVIIAAKSQYGTEQIHAAAPVALYLIFIFVALFLTETVFGEDE